MPIDEQFLEFERRLDKYRAERLQEDARVRAERTARLTALDNGTRDLASRSAEQVGGDARGSGQQ